MTEKQAQIYFNQLLHLLPLATSMDS